MAVQIRRCDIKPSQNTLKYQIKQTPETGSNKSAGKLLTAKIGHAVHRLTERGLERVRGVRLDAESYAYPRLEICDLLLQPLVLLSELHHF